MSRLKSFILEYEQPSNGVLFVDRDRKGYRSDSRDSRRSPHRKDYRSDSSWRDRQCGQSGQTGLQSSGRSGKTKISDDVLELVKPKFDALDKLINIMSKDMSDIHKKVDKLVEITVPVTDAHYVMT